MKKVFFLFVLIVTLNCAMNAQNENNWMQIVSVSELIGSWTGSQNIAIPQNEATGIPNSFLTFSLHIEYALASKEIVFEMMIDMNKFLDDWIKVPSVKDLGINKDLLWGLLTGVLGGMLDGEAVFDNTYKMFYSLYPEPESFVSSDNLYINGNKNMIKLIFNDPVSFGLGDEGLTEILLTKN